MKRLTIITYVELSCSWLVAKGHYTWLTIGDKRKHYSITDLAKMGQEFVANNPDFILDLDDVGDVEWVNKATNGNIKIDLKHDDISMRPLFTRVNGMHFFEIRSNSALVDWFKTKYINRVK